MNHSCVKLLQDSTCVSSYNWVVSRTSNTLPSFRQSLTTFNTSSSKFGLEFGWWKDRPPLLRTTRWPQNYQRITLTITLRLSQNNSTNSDKVGVAKNMSIVTTQEVWRMSWLEFKIQRQATSKYQLLGTAASCQLHQDLHLTKSGSLSPFLASSLPEVSTAISNNKPTPNRLMCKWLNSFFQLMFAKHSQIVV